MDNSSAFEFEKSLSRERFTAWMVKYWTVCVWFSVAYVVLIFGGRRFMESRSSFGLKRPLAIWSGMLAVFSMMGAWRMLPDLMYVTFTRGFHETVCTVEWQGIIPLTFWTILFTLSKVVELGDTVFIILRKQPLIFLHWYHHITVLIYTWFSVSQLSSSGRWFICMNYGVHALMYTYYTAKAMNVYVPKFLRMCITTLQLSQMVVGIIVSFYAYYRKNSGESCGVTYENIYYSFLMYLSYFLLFAKFFYDAYMRPSRHTSAVNGLQTNGCVKAETLCSSNGYSSGHSNGHTKKSV